MPQNICLQFSMTLSQYGKPIKISEKKIENKLLYLLVKKKKKKLERKKNCREKYIVFEHGGGIKW